MNLFTIAPNDRSIYYLSQVFGVVGDLLASQNPVLLFGTIFHVFNSAVLTVAGFTIAYITVVGLGKTAHEGEFLGKQWHSFWVPARILMGSSMLIPSASGYTLVQILFMWIIVQGVGAADSIWSAAVQYTQVVGSLTATATGTSSQNAAGVLTTNADNVKSLFKSLVCQATAKQNYAAIGDLHSGTPPANTLRYYCAEHANSAFCQQDSQQDMLNFTNNKNCDPSKDADKCANKKRYYMGPKGACGYLDISTSCDSSLDSALCTDLKNARDQALTAMVTVLGEIARQVAIIDHDYAQYFGAGVTCSTQGDTVTCNQTFTAPSWMLSYCANQTPAISSNTCCLQVSTATAGCELTVGNVGNILAKEPYLNTDASVDAVNNLYVPQAMSNLLGTSDLGFINTTYGQFVATILGAQSQWVSSQIGSSTVNKDAATWQLNAQTLGWVTAGTFLYDMAMNNASKLKDLTGFLTISVNPPSQVPAALGTGYRSNYDTAANILKQINTQQGSGSSNNNSSGSSAQSTGIPGFDEVLGKLQSVSTLILNAFIDAVSGGDGNPFLKIVQFGWIMMIAAKGLFVALIIIFFIVGSIANISPIVLGNGLTQNPLGRGLDYVSGMVSALCGALLSAMYLMGATLGIYMPLIPYIYFLVGVLGWLIQCVEAMVAAPIAILGMLSPGGQHEVLGRAEPGLMHIMNLFLRPGLMVMGLLAGYLVCITVIHVLNAGFAHVAAAIFANSPGIPSIARSASISAPGSSGIGAFDSAAKGAVAATNATGNFFIGVGNFAGGSINAVFGGGIIECLFFIGVYTSLILTLVNKSFSLIYSIPNQILTWLGAPAAQYGEASEALQGAQKGVGETAGTITSGASKVRQRDEKEKKKKDEGKSEVDIETKTET